MLVQLRGDVDHLPALKDPLEHLVLARDSLWLHARQQMWRYDPALDTWSGPIATPDLDTLVEVGGELYLVETYRGVDARVLRYDAP